MHALLKLVSYAGLALTIVPSVLVYRGAIEMDMHYKIMIVGMLLWFGSAVVWIKQDKALE
ncbi:MAG: hypothetical protein KF688_14400 [Pirellulales bacterium]|nr:hypothetical protein [Pirellulales bacterium]MBX3434532.1 hypothetical protein [Pirellulales bacterium]